MRRQNNAYVPYLTQLNIHFNTKANVVLFLDHLGISKEGTPQPFSKEDNKLKRGSREYLCLGFQPCFQHTSIK